MLNKTYPYYLANEAVAANTDLEVTDKFSGEVATRVAMADAAAIDKAIGYAVDAHARDARVSAVQAPGRARTLREALSRALRRTGDGAVHRSRQADQRFERRSHAADRYVQGGGGGSRCASTARSSIWRFRRARRVITAM